MLKKDELIKAVSKESNVEKKDVISVTDAYGKVFVEEMKAGRQFKFPGIGTFTPKHQQERHVNGRNPQTGAELNYSIPEQIKVSKFHITKDADKLINPHLYDENGNKIKTINKK